MLLKKFYKEVIDLVSMNQPKWLRLSQKMDYLFQDKLIIIIIILSIVVDFWIIIKKKIWIQCKDWFIIYITIIKLRFY